jgi:hypothetical protein
MIACRSIQGFYIKLRENKVRQEFPKGTYEDGAEWRGNTAATPNPSW